MKKITLTLLCLAAMVGTMVMTGCKATAKEACRIHGTMESSRWDGKRIFLVPMFGPQDAAHVDSVVIQDGKFEFAADTAEMKIIRVDYHYREGAQDLLIVSEPGDIQVTIGANSTSAGTPQNDSLQVWKDRIMEFNRTYNKLRMQAAQSGSNELLMTEGKELQKALRSYNEAFAARMTPGIFKDYLLKMYPSAK